MIIIKIMYSVINISINVIPCQHLLVYSSALPSVRRSACLPSDVSNAPKGNGIGAMGS